MKEVSQFLPDLIATQRIAESLATQIKPGEVIYLYGDLGTGKTTLVQVILKIWHYPGLVTSPTFTLVEPYRLPEFTVYHFDFYRLNDPKDLTAIGIREYFLPNSICFIEWPDAATGFIPAADWTIHLSYFQDGRKITIEHS